MRKAGKHIGKNLPPPPDISLPDDITISIQSADTPELGMRQFVFCSPVMRGIYSIATQVAGSDASVLIYGESGTGKELFARLLHMLSGRNTRPFVPVNCGVLQGELFADKFFGHEAGAFTGANKARIGAFEAAATGTLFLDEVGEVPSVNQVDFLRVLEERSFRRMGGEKDIPFQARIVAATNRPLEKMVREGAFRADLFYRLNVIPVCLPPLRARKEDIELLTRHTLSVFKHRYHRPELTLHNTVLRVFEKYSWPGNVRELRNLVERLVLLARGPQIMLDALPMEMRPGAPPSDGNTSLSANDSEEPLELTLAAAVGHAESRAIIRAFHFAGGHKGRTAEVLGISERSLRYKIAEYKLRL